MKAERERENALSLEDVFHSFFCFFLPARRLVPWTKKPYCFEQERMLCRSSVDLVEKVCQSSF